MIVDPVQGGFDPAYHLIDLALEVIMMRMGLHPFGLLCLPEPAEVGVEQVPGVLDRVGQRGLGAVQIVDGLPRQCTYFAHSLPESDDLIPWMHALAREHLDPLAHVEEV